MKAWRFSEYSWQWKINHEWRCSFLSKNGDFPLPGSFRGAFFSGQNRRSGFFGSKHQMIFFETFGFNDTPISCVYQKKVSFKSIFSLQKKKQQFRFCHGNLKGPTAPNTNSPEPGLKSFQNNQNWLMNATILFPGARMGGRFKLQHWVVVSIFFDYRCFLGKWSNLTNVFQMGWNHQQEQISVGELLFESFSNLQLSNLFFCYMSAENGYPPGNENQKTYFPTKREVGALFFSTQVGSGSSFWGICSFWGGYAKTPLLGGSSQDL